MKNHEEDKIVVLACNPRLEKSDDGSFNISPQLRAFEEALNFIQGRRQQIATIFLAFDHLGSFNNQFLAEGVSCRQRRHLKFSHLDPDIRTVYEPILQPSGIRHDEIKLITEEQCRLQIGRIKSGVDPQVPSELKRWFTDHTTGQAVCRGIFAEFFRRMSIHGTSLHAFWEHDLEHPKRINLTHIGTAGYVIKHVLGLNVTIENHVVLS